MSLPCQRPESPRDTDSGISEESALFLRAIGIAKERGFDWLQILPEDRTDWARRVLEWEAKESEMTGQHTPGPWSAAPTSRSGDYIETTAITEEDLPYLIECPGSGGAMSYSSTICHLHWTGTAEWTANAHLIAAAPDLLDALRAVKRFGGLASVQIHSFDTPPKPAAKEVWQFPRHLLTEIDDAIAKAEGRTP